MSYKNIQIICQNQRYSQEMLHIISQTPKFRKWVDQLNLQRIGFTHFDLTDVDWFCAPQSISATANLGFIKGKCMYLPSSNEVYYNRLPNGGEERKERKAGELTGAIDLVTKKLIPGNIVFIRGGSVAVLIIIEVENEDEPYVLMCSQVRIPSGDIISELPAGMLDASSNVTLVALKEIEEETGLKLNTHDLQSLGSFFPSPGGCDEEISLFFTKKTISQRLFQQKKDIVFGEIINEHDEGIRLNFIKVSEVEAKFKEIKDAKLEIAWNRAKSMGFFNYKTLNQRIEDVEIALTNIIQNYRLDYSKK